MGDAELSIDAELLRRRAEARLAELHAGPPISEVDAQRLVHELQVHQIELQMQNEALTATQDELQAALQELRVAAITFESGEGVLITDAEGRILRVNQAFTRLSGFTLEEVLHSTPAMLSAGQHPAAFYEAMWADLLGTGYWQGEVRNRRKDGEIYLQWLTISAVRDARGNVIHYVGAFSDITRHKQAEAEIHRLAYYDQLTQLPNRRMFLERLAQAMLGVRHSRQCCMLLFIDLDNFKTLNDTRGHNVGDQLLVQVGARIKLALRQSDVVARLGGDEFVVMLEGLDGDPVEAAIQTGQVAEKIRAALDEPYQLEGAVHACSASFGATVFAGGFESPDVLLKQADLAMYRAKHGGGDAVRFFDPTMQQAIDARTALEADMRLALTRGEFRVFLQPELDAGNRVCGAEALLRWIHPVRGLLMPGEFVALAEDTGLIVPIGQWMLRQVATLLAQWSASPVTCHLVLAINVSARELREQSFSAGVAEVLTAERANPARLRIELTESALVNDIDALLPRLQAIRALGVHFALDDFGTGFSCLSYLTRLPLTCLKIDQSFVQRLRQSSSDAVVVRTVISMANSLGLQVVAEGVETQEQRDFLLANACHTYQGYLFSRPLSVADFGNYLLANGTC